MKITEKSTLSVGLAITLISGISWLTKMSYQSSANAEGLKTQAILQETQYDKIQRTLEDINKRLSNIEGRLSR